jgi:hypothetical protein
MISRLVAISPAPSHTSPALCRQIRSTRCPSGIFKAQGIPAQKPRAARKAADKPRDSLTKKGPDDLGQPGYSCCDIDQQWRQVGKPHCTAEFKREQIDPGSGNLKA